MQEQRSYNILLRHTSDPPPPRNRVDKEYRNDERDGIRLVYNIEGYI